MKQKLYIKNDKGRYEEYREPQDVDNKLYRKINGKYSPIAVEYNHDNLHEGVWIVYRNVGGRSIISGKYLKDLYSIEKMSDLQPLNLNYAQLGAIDKVVNEATRYAFDNGNNCSTYELIKKAVAYALDKLLTNQP